MRLSKSRFVSGVICLKRLYWQVYEPELAAEPDESTQAIFDQGHEVGRLAQKLCPGGIEVEGSQEDLDQAIRQTKELMANREIPAIFEATFEEGGVLVRVDILQRQRDRWRLIEVKSSTDLKDYHLYDLCIQKRVVSRCGVELSSACIMHLNRDYVYPGGEYDIRQLFRIRMLNAQVAALQPQIGKRVAEEFRILDQPNAPEIAPGDHCRDPFECEFLDRCIHPVPGDHVLHLPRISAKRVEELESMGITSILQVPDDFPLNERQRRACTSVQQGKPWFSEDLPMVLDSLKFPLYFMDFETVYPAIPRYPGMRPFDQLPFQWSVHFQEKPEAELRHHEFLATTNAEPRREFIEKLCSVLGSTGSIVVYNEGFESQRLADLAGWVPGFRTRIKKIQARLWDLWPIIRNHVYYPAFGGSFSLKAVLPALIPKMTYAGMDVADGIQAGVAWEKLVRGGLDATPKDRLGKALLAYCGQDTLAMARLVEFLRRQRA
jgi:predicted RecB family nuclease